MRKFQREFQPVFIGEIHIRLVQHHHAILRATEFFQLRSFIAAPARRIRRRHQSQRRIEPPFFFTAQIGRARQGKIGVQRHGVFRRAVDVRQHRIQRIARREVLHRRFRQIAAIFQLPAFRLRRFGFHKRAHRQRQHFIRAVAHQNIFRRAAVQPRQLRTQHFRRGIGIQPQPSVHGGLHRAQHFRRGRIRILIRVQLDEARNFRLLARHIRVQAVNQRTDQIFWTAR